MLTNLKYILLISYHVSSRMLVTKDIEMKKKHPWSTFYWSDSVPGTWNTAVGSCSHKIYMVFHTLMGGRVLWLAQ